MTDRKILDVDHLATTINEYDGLQCTVTTSGGGRYHGIAYVFGITGHLVPVQLEVILNKDTIAFGLEGVVVETQEQVANGLSERKKIEVEYRTQQPPQKGFIPLRIADIDFRQAKKKETRDMHFIDRGSQKYTEYEQYGEHKIPKFKELGKSSAIYELFIDTKRSKKAQQIKLQRGVNSSKYLTEMRNVVGEQLPAQVHSGKKPYFIQATAKELTKALINAGFTYYGNNFCT